MDSSMIDPVAYLDNRLGSLVPASMRTDRDTFRRARLTLGFTLAVMLIFPCYVGTHYLVGDREGSLVLIAVVALYPFTLVLLRQTRSLAVAANFGIALFYLVSTYFAYTQGGLTSPSLIPKLASPIAALMFAGWGSLYFWVGLELGTIIVFYLLGAAKFPFPHHIPPQWLELDRLSQLLGSVVAVAILFALSEAERRRTLRSLDLERDKSERLLLNVLPAPIAERLKRDAATIADSYGDVTVFFADIVGFTKLSAGSLPRRWWTS